MANLLSGTGCISDEGWSRRTDAKAGVAFVSSESECRKRHRCAVHYGCKPPRLVGRRTGTRRSAATWSASTAIRHISRWSLSSLGRQACNKVGYYEISNGPPTDPVEELGMLWNG